MNITFSKTTNNIYIYRSNVIQNSIQPDETISNKRREKGYEKIVLLYLNIM